MFVIKQTDSYVWPVTVKLPKDGGRFDAQTFDAVFKRIPQTKISEIQGRVAEGLAVDNDLAREVLIDWKGVTDGENEVPFSEGLRDQLLDIPGVGTAIVLAFVESLSGARRKN
jgi:hypothetical protein